MASLADVMDDQDDAPMDEDADKASAAEDVMAAIKSSNADALATALEAFIRSVS